MTARTPYATLTHARNDILWLRLVWLYGMDRALAIVTGKDERTEADLAAWRDLGRHD